MHVHIILKWSWCFGVNEKTPVVMMMMMKMLIMSTVVCVGVPSFHECTKYCPSVKYITLSFSKDLFVLRKFSLLPIHFYMDYIWQSASLLLFGKSALVHCWIRQFIFIVFLNRYIRDTWIHGFSRFLIVVGRHTYLDLWLVNIVE